MKKSISGIFKEGILTNNPTFVQLLGMCPTLATTTSVVNALGMGAAVIVVLAFSNLFISLLRRIIPKQVRIASYIVIISGFVTAVELLIKAYFPARKRSPRKTDRLSPSATASRQASALRWRSPASPSSAS